MAQFIPLSQFNNFNMTKIKLLIVLFLLASGLARAQNYVGYQSSNYAGINSINTNPANIVDSRYAFDINLLGFDFRLSNNYLGLSTDLLKIKIGRAHV